MIQLKTLDSILVLVLSFETLFSCISIKYSFQKVSMLFLYFNFSLYIFEILFNLLNYILFQKKNLFIKSYSI